MTTLAIDILPEKKFCYDRQEADDIRNCFKMRAEYLTSTKTPQFREDTFWQSPEGVISLLVIGFASGYLIRGELQR